MLLIKRIFLVALLLPSLSISQEADIQAGKSLFNANCAACHQLNRKAVGPALSGVTEKYDKTVFIEEALHRLVEVYYRLGLIDEAKKAAAILGYNYQSGEWYERSYKVFNKKYKTKKIIKEKERGLIRKIKGLFD